MNHMPGNLAYRAYRLLWEAMDWLYPPNCGGCGQSGARWCKLCSQNTHEIEPPICPICGDYNVNDGACLRCQTSRPFYTSLRSHTIFKGSIREAIHQLKYRRNIGLGEALSRPMIASLKKLNWSLDIITSVPLGLVRLDERGYNQANLLARPIALCLKVPFSSRVLIRTRETRSQVGLTSTERQENMTDAFRAKSKLVKGKTILVVDDVATSGATLNACAKALLDEGASMVYGFSLARAVFTPNMEIDIA
jgi:competence protein ComFC